MRIPMHTARPAKAASRAITSRREWHPDCSLSGMGTRKTRSHYGLALLALAAVCLLLPRRAAADGLTWTLFDVSLNNIQNTPILGSFNFSGTFPTWNVTVGSFIYGVSIVDAQSFNSDIGSPNIGGTVGDPTSEVQFSNYDPSDPQGYLYALNINFTSHDLNVPGIVTITGGSYTLPSGLLGVGRVTVPLAVSGFLESSGTPLQSTPEPATAALLGTGALLLLGLSWRRSGKTA
jgi:hypothetical protein